MFNLKLWHSYHVLQEQAKDGHDTWSLEGLKALLAENGITFSLNIIDIVHLMECKGYLSINRYEWLVTVKAEEGDEAS